MEQQGIMECPPQMPNSPPTHSPGLSTDFTMKLVHETSAAPVWQNWRSGGAKTSTNIRQEGSSI